MGSIGINGLAIVSQGSIRYLEVLLEGDDFREQGEGVRHLTRDPVAGIFSSFGPQSSQWDNEDKRRQVHAERRIHRVFGLNLLLLVFTHLVGECAIVCGRKSFVTS